MSFARYSMDDCSVEQYLLKDSEIWPALRECLDQRSEPLFRIAVGWGERWAERAREEGVSEKDIRRARALAEIVGARAEESTGADQLPQPLSISHIYAWSVSVFYPYGDDVDDLEEPDWGEG